MKMKHPSTRSASFGGQQFDIGEDGLFEIPTEFLEPAQEHGFSGVQEEKEEESEEKEPEPGLPAILMSLHPIKDKTNKDLTEFAEETFFRVLSGNKDNRIAQLFALAEEFPEGNKEQK